MEKLFIKKITLVFVLMSNVIVGQNQFMLDKEKGIIISEGETTEYFNVFSEIHETFPFDYFNNIPDDTIILDIVYDENLEAYTATWKEKKSDSLIQKGTFNKEGESDGRFEGFSETNSAYCYYKGGLKEGVQVIELTNLTLVSNYSNNKRNGASYIIQDGLFIKSIVHYKNDELDGFAEAFWLPEGKMVLNSTTNYKDGEIQDGLHIIYHPNGAKWIESNYKDGLLHGWEITYNSLEEVTKKRKFYKGEIVPKEEW